VTDIQEIGVSLLPPITVGKLQTALHTKAKNSPDYRFYALYDKLYRRDILEWAFVRCRNNRGAPGVDGQSFADIETYGRDQWLDELTEELRNGTYRPRPVRRVYIPKGDGKLRPLGIPICRSYCTSLQRRWGLKPVLPHTGLYFSYETDFRVQVRRFGLRKPAMISDVSLIHQGA
jgi:RNA-directed DNA polymerase